MKRSKRGYNWRYPLAGFGLAVVIFLVSLWLFPEWLYENRSLAALAGLAILAAFSLLPGFIDPFKKPENQTPQTGPVQGDYIAHDKIIQQAPQHTPALHQLQSPPDDFIGREAELAELLQAAQTGGAHITGLQGMGGVGKTALALVLADQLKESFPAVQLYLNLQGASRQPLSPIEAMGIVIHAFQPGLKLPENLNEISGIYRSLLNAQPALLVLDNARNAAQVEPLLPPAGCLALVTSRAHFALPGLFTLNLEALPVPGSRHLPACRR